MDFTGMLGSLLNRLLGWLHRPVTALWRSLVDCPPITYCGQHWDFAGKRVAAGAYKGALHARMQCSRTALLFPERRVLPYEALGACHLFLGEKGLRFFQRQQPPAPETFIPRSVMMAAFVKVDDGFCDVTIHLASRKLHKVMIELDASLASEFEKILADWNVLCWRI